MRNAVLCVALLIISAACHKATPAPAPAPAVPAAVAKAPAVQRPVFPHVAVTHSFGGSCTVTVYGTTVCTDYFEDAATVQKGCTQAVDKNAKTSYSAGHCTAKDLVGKCTTSFGPVNYYYRPSPLAAMQRACKNSHGTWASP